MYIVQLFAGYLTLNSYEDGFLTLADQRITGNLNIAASAMWGMRDTRAFADIFLNHPLFGQNTRLSAGQIMDKTGCDFCWFSFYFDNHVRFRNHTAARVSVAPATELGNFMWDFSCMFRK